MGDGLTTEEIMRVALDLVGFTAVPPDSAVHVPGAGIRRILFGLDIDPGTLVMAKQMGYDCVICHHPRGTLLEQGQLFRDHYRIMGLFGIPEDRARAAVGEFVEHTVRHRRTMRMRSLMHEAWTQTVIEVDVARMLGMPFLNIHQPTDELGRRVVQRHLDEGLAGRPGATVGDVVDALYELPETRIARAHFDMPCEVAVGAEEAPAGRVAFVHGAYFGPNYDLVRFYWDNGIRTVVALFTDFASVERLRKEAAGALIWTGHYTGDSYGFTPFLTELRRRGATVDCIAGAIDVAAHPAAPNPRRSA